MAEDQKLSSTFTYDEVVALKALANKAEKKWWKDYPFLVSLLAFLLALSTSLISAYGARLHDIHDQQSQLAAALGHLQELNLQQVELHEKYKNTPYESQASGLINNEINSTLHTAGKLGRQLGKNATTADLAGVAWALYGLSDYTVTEELLKNALAAAETANDESIALRYLGFYMIRIGRGGESLKQGEDYFTRALTLDRKYNLSEQPKVIAWLRSAAQLAWAGALASVDCAAAQKHFDEGVTILASAPADIDFEQARSGAKQQWIAGIGGVASCHPDSNAAQLP
jgi:hypothetical protein